MVIALCAIVMSAPQATVSSDVLRLYDATKMPELKLKALIAQASVTRDGVAYIPNGYRANDPIPYMPGSGEPLIGREDIEVRRDWARN